MARDNKAFVGTWLPRDTHTALIHYATNQGKDPSDLAAQLIGDGLADLFAYRTGTMDEPNPVMELHHMYLQSRQRNVMRQQLVALAVTAIQTNVSEKYIDAVERLSTENGFDFEEIKVEAQNLTRISSTAVFVTEQDGNLGKAARLLAELFSSRNSIAVSVIEEIAEQKGISINALRVVKRQMGLVSVRKEKHWVWETQYQVAPSMVESRV